MNFMHFVGIHAREKAFQESDEQCKQGKEFGYPNQENILQYMPSVCNMYTQFIFLVCILPIHCDTQ